MVPKFGLQMLGVAFLISLIGVTDTTGAELPSGFIETQITDRLIDPTRIRFSPDGRIFVLEQSGTIRVIKNGVLSERPFLSLKVDYRGEHGLLGLAFDPEFEKNGYVYIYHSTLNPMIHNRISRFDTKGDEAIPESEKILIDFDPTLKSIFHSAGDLHFHSDGTLYVGVGDNANHKNAQLLTNPFGKILRFNRDGSIPQDNPLYNQTTGLEKAIWAYGFRNPFSFHFQDETDRMYINDVGADSWEEINEGQAGGNYGWAVAEGPSSDPRFIAPIYTYSHGPITSEEQGCAITGGTFYPLNPRSPATAFPKVQRGLYFFIDYCNAWLRTLNPKDHTVASFGKSLAPNPVSLEIGPDGKLYYLSRWTHALYSIEYRPN